MKSDNENNTGGNSASEFEKMQEIDKTELIKLIQSKLCPRKSINTKMSSYGLKHIFEKMIPSGYISNGEMKGAMLYCGYISRNMEDINWYFNISSRSPLFPKVYHGYKFRQF